MAPVDPPPKLPIVRIILHIGMPKAGSTALQAALAAARRPLGKAGVLYPKGAFNHNFLVAGIAPVNRLGRVFAQHREAVGVDDVAVDVAQPQVPLRRGQR